MKDTEIKLDPLVDAERNDGVSDVPSSRRGSYIQYAHPAMWNKLLKRNFIVGRTSESHRSEAKPDVNLFDNVKLREIRLELSAKVESDVGACPWIRSIVAYGVSFKDHDAFEARGPNMYKDECLILAMDVANCQFWHKNLSIKCRLHELANKQRI
ncbi:hypothetical protein SUGI_0998440 [Cryptomeria japonica]|nr:hypothetical protein SUGI_0998440 [Cryptomeria japonica]